MKKIFGLLFLMSTSIVLVNCGNKDEPVVAEIRDYATQYAADIASIETFLKTHSITNPGIDINQDVAFGEVADGSPLSIWNQTTYPLTSSNVVANGITYKVYHIMTRIGSGANSKSPTNYDEVLVSYKGQLLDGTVFDSNPFPQGYFNLANVIRGWNEILPKFKTGNYTQNTNGTVTYDNYGAGIVFFPSGLGYYSSAPTNIPAYSPLIFNMKLLEINRLDHDGDGVLSVNEANSEGYLRTASNTQNGGADIKDTDLDGVPDFLDIDDDNDGYTTRYEIARTLPLASTTTFYPFDGAATDDSSTAIDETHGIPDCSGDKTSATRIRRHVDKNCH